MTLTCPTCGEPFECARTHIDRSKTPKAAFCSEACYQKDWNATHLTPGRMPPRMREGDGTGWLAEKARKTNAAE